MMYSYNTGVFYEKRTKNNRTNSTRNHQHCGAKRQKRDTENVLGKHIDYLEEELRNTKEESAARFREQKRNLRTQLEQANQMQQTKDVEIRDLQMENKKQYSDLLRSNKQLAENNLEIAYLKRTKDNLYMEVEQLKVLNENIKTRSNKQLADKDKEILELKKKIADEQKALDAIVTVLKPRIPIEMDRLENETLVKELETRMKCDICLEGTHSRSCPTCRKGLCGSCYDRIKGGNNFMRCPHCVTVSNEWPRVNIPRI